MSKHDIEIVEILFENFFCKDIDIINVYINDLL